jgi:hypothetical protein
MLLTFPALFLFTEAGRSFGLDSFIVPRLTASPRPILRLLRWLF